MWLDYLRARAAFIVQIDTPARALSSLQVRDFIKAALRLADQLDLSPQAATTPSVAAQQSQGIEALPF